jgi:hypothetical protein
MLANVPLSCDVPLARTMQAMTQRPQKLPQGLRKANACGGGVRPLQQLVQEWRPPVKQESPLAMVGVPWVHPWGDVNPDRIFRCHPHPFRTIVPSCSLPRLASREVHDRTH